MAATMGLVAMTGAFGYAHSTFAQTPTAERSENYIFAFQNADVSQVVQEVLGAAGIPFNLDPTVTGKISFRIEQRLTRDQLVASLEAVLSANGAAMVRNGEQITITPQSKAKSMAQVRQGAQALRGAGYEIVAVPLGYAQPTEVARALEAISGNESVVFANDRLSLLLLGGSGGQLKSTLETLKILDQSAFQDSKIRWFELAQAQSNTVAAELQQIVQGAGLVGVSVVPLRRLNGVILFGRSSDALTEIGKWVARLDAPSKDLSSTLWIYHPRNSSAEALSRTLGGLLGSQSNTGVSGIANTNQNPVAPATTSVAAAPSPIVPTNLGTAGVVSDDDVRVSVDKESNSLLFYATPNRWVQIQRILNEIDKSQRQILIEASIVEVTLGRQYQYGLDWSVFNEHLRGGVINNAAGTPGLSFPGLSIAYVNKDIQAAVSALGSMSAIEVVSAPKIIALDNKTARLQIGDQVPVVTQASQATTGANTAIINAVDYRSTGVILTVTPRINGEDQLVLEVSQEVSNVATTNTSGIDSPTIQQRRFESALNLQSGSTVALGGLISSTRSNSNSGVPGLKDIPALGTLFRTTGQDRSRTELVVLLSATIIADRAALDKAMADLSSDMHELQSRGLLNASP